MISRSNKLRIKFWIQRITSWPLIIFRKCSCLFSSSAFFQHLQNIFFITLLILVCFLWRKGQSLSRYLVKVIYSYLYSFFITFIPLHWQIIQPPIKMLTAMNLGSKHKGSYNSFNKISSVKQMYFCQNWQLGSNAVGFCDVQAFKVRLF